MYVAGIDAHSSYLVVAVVSKSGELLERRRIRAAEPKRLSELLAKYRPLTVVVETSSAWPWIHDLLVPQGISFVLAHALDQHTRAPHGIPIRPPDGGGGDPPPLTRRAL